MRTKRTKVAARSKFETTVMPGPQAQVALVAMDPHTGEIKALVGGRNYGTSQLNHALAKRPTGSIFKPFVYAAAMNTAIDGSTAVITPASIVSDQPTTFTYGDQIYEPRNYKEEYHGDVTLRYALALSLNNATVKLAEEVGYDKVADLARSAGITSVKATPAMAIGAYDATPVDMAAAYTSFANGGLRLSPVFVNSVRNAKGDIVVNFATEKKQVLDPRIAFVMTNMLEGVMNFGTAAGVRSRGFTAPAAGKTGTSHDGWFAGYTSNLLCIVWVGYDDYSDIHLEGAHTAAPIWAEFMKKAVTLPQYDGRQALHPARKAWSMSSSIRSPTAWRRPLAPTITPLPSLPDRASRYLRPDRAVYRGSSPVCLAEIPRKRCLRPEQPGTRNRPTVSNLMRRQRKRRAFSARLLTCLKGTAPPQKTTRTRLRRLRAAGARRPSSRVVIIQSALISKARIRGLKLAGKVTSYR